MSGDDGSLGKVMRVGTAFMASVPCHMCFPAVSQRLVVGIHDMSMHLIPSLIHPLGRAVGTHEPEPSRESFNLW